MFTTFLKLVRSLRRSLCNKNFDERCGGLRSGLDDGKLRRATSLGWCSAGLVWSVNIASLVVEGLLQDCFKFDLRGKYGSNSGVLAVVDRAGDWPA